VPRGGSAVSEGDSVDSLPGGGALPDLSKESQT